MFQQRECFRERNGAMFFKRAVERWGASCCRSVVRELLNRRRCCEHLLNLINDCGQTFSSSITEHFKVERKISGKSKNILIIARVSLKVGVVAIENSRFGRNFCESSAMSWFHGWGRNGSRSRVDSSGRLSFLKLSGAEIPRNFPCHHNDSRKQREKLSETHKQRKNAPLTSIHVERNVKRAERERR